MWRRSCSILEEQIRRKRVAMINWRSIHWSIPVRLGPKIFPGITFHYSKLTSMSVMIGKIIGPNFEQIVTLPHYSDDQRNIFKITVYADTYHVHARKRTIKRARWRRIVSPKITQYTVKYNFFPFCVISWFSCIGSKSDSSICKTCKCLGGLQNS